MDGQTDEKMNGSKQTESRATKINVRNEMTGSDKHRLILIHARTQRGEYGDRQKAAVFSWTANNTDRDDC